MITARNEFETVPAFTNVAGCSIGTQTARATTAELITVLGTVSQCDTCGYWKELAEMCDDDTDTMFEIQQDVVSDLDDHMPMPFGCYVTLADNEWTVLPSVDSLLEEGDVEQVDEVPDERDADHVYTVSDHGNVTMYEWKYHYNDPAADGYVEIWAVV